MVQVLADGLSLGAGPRDLEVGAAPLACDHRLPGLVVAVVGIGAQGAGPGRPHGRFSDPSTALAGGGDGVQVVGPLVAEGAAMVGEGAGPARERGGHSVEELGGV